MSATGPSTIETFRDALLAGRTDPAGRPVLLAALAAAELDGLDPRQVDRARLVIEYFTNPPFRRDMEELVWRITSGSGPADDGAATFPMVGSEPAVEESPATIPIAAAPSPLARILAAPLPTYRSHLRSIDRVDRAKAIRRLFRDLGLSGISVTTPSHSMASGNDIRIPDAVEHEQGWQSDHDRLTCRHCREHRAALDHIRAIVLAAFPDLDDRSDHQSDYFDDPLHID